MSPDHKIPNEVLEWLLEPSNPSVRYRTMLELLDYSPKDPEIQQTYKEILNWKPVLKIKKAMHPEGYWTVKVEKGNIIGKGTEYRTFNTTHWVLGYLAEYGLTRKEDFVNIASNRYLNLQKDDGDFWQHLSCLYGLNLHTFSKLGFNSDPRIQKTIELVTSSIRHDNGYLCDLNERKKKPKGREIKSCFRGTLKVLFGLSEFSSLWDQLYAKKLIDYFLNRELIFKRNKPTELVVKNAELLVFPFTYREGLLETLYPLLKMGYGNHPKCVRAWELFESKKLPDGRFPLEWNPTNKFLRPGTRGEPNKWVTFYAYLLYKLKET
ncbi:hypothetical protein NEF87_002333 [Candidatus Lokiarchaeum ossiferum]|uniref:Glycosyl hydrolase n=1 Tax=Candidatus Lokiarchaeum ossiferum TaxID=2951803 RepID=A0ABY6HRB5_9ARCH|nr:hypothetical protein NEF87_002333 [Candidatus Lokiarchaeum sp. B-35]